MHTFRITVQAVLDEKLAMIVGGFVEQLLQRSLVEGKSIERVGVLGMHGQVVLRHYVRLVRWLAAEGDRGIQHGVVQIKPRVS